MTNFLLYSLKTFRGCFARERTWVVFCMVILGFIGANEMIGVTSLCRFWGLGETGYKMFLNFFRSSAWSLPSIVFFWGQFVLSQNKLVFVGGRVVLQGDHTFVPKDGRRMPGVVTLHQDSETQSKPSYFRGHCWGALVGLVGSSSAFFGIPLKIGIHQGFTHINKEEGKEPLGVQIVRMAVDFCSANGLKCILTLDAFFSKRRSVQNGQRSFLDS